MAVIGARGGQRGAARAGAGRGSVPVPLRPLRILLLGLGLASLLAALWAGLLRLGLTLPDLDRTLPPAHGPLMVSGFLGTVISLERAVALGRRWAYLPPALSALGAILLVAGLPVWTGALAMTAGSVLLVVVFAAILRRQAALFTVTMTVGAIAWLIGNLIWLDGAPIAHVVLWWMGFLVLTIAGERLELSRLLQPSPRSRWWFTGAVVVFVVGLATWSVDADVGARVIGLALAALPLWLYRHDVVRRTVHQRGLPRFIAVCVFTGYAWLVVGGLLQIRYGGVVGGAAYDAVLHTVFLGFVFVMIFAHAPIIIPSVIGRPVPYRPVFYAHVGLLHLSLVVRVAGDLAGWTVVRQTGGVLNETALLLFLVVTLASARAGARSVATRRASAAAKGAEPGSSDSSAPVTRQAPAGRAGTSRCPSDGRTEGVSS